MKYEVVFRERVIDLLIEWKPPDPVLDDLEHCVHEQLAADPVGCLRKIGHAAAMQYSRATLDQDGGRVHVILLRVHYGEDEKSLFVYDAFYYTFTR